MNAIIELVQSSKPNPIFLKGKGLELFQLIRKGKITNKEEALRHLYNGAKSGERSLYYLIQRTKRLLILSTISNIKHRNDLEKTYNKVYSTYCATMILRGAGKMQTFASEANKLLPLVKEYEFVNIGNELCKWLSYHHCINDIDAKKVKEYEKEASRYAMMIQQSTVVNAEFSKCMAILNRKSSYSVKVKQTIKQAIQRLNFPLTDTFAIYQYYTLTVIDCFTQYDYLEAFELCQKAINEIAGRKAARSGQLAHFYMIQGICATASQQYEEAENALSKALELVGHVPMSFQAVLFYRAVNAIHAQRYFKARHFMEVANREKPNKHMVENWALIGAYVYFFIGGDFKLGKFLNQTATLSKDKQGANINIIIAELIICITDKRDRFYKRMEAVQKYSYTHLKGKANERARLFLKMLFEIPRNDFYRRRIEQANRFTALKLRRRSINANHNLEIEIAPFEHIWATLLDRVHKRETIKEIA